MDLTRKVIPGLFHKMFDDHLNNSKQWQLKNLSDICELINGHAFKTSEWTEMGLPIIRIQNLNHSDKPYNFYSGTLPEKYLINVGDVLLSWSGTPGTSFGCFKWKGPKGWLNQHIFKVIFKYKIEEEYFIHRVNLGLKFLIEKAVGGVGLQHLTKSMLNSMSIMIPPLSTQQEFTEKVQEIRALQAEQEESLQKFDLLFEGLLHRTLSGN